MAYYLKPWFCFYHFVFDLIKSTHQPLEIKKNSSPPATMHATSSKIFYSIKAMNVWSDWMFDGKWTNRKINVWQTDWAMYTKSGYTWCEMSFIVSMWCHLVVNLRGASNSVSYYMFISNPAIAGLSTANIGATHWTINKIIIIIICDSIVNQSLDL